MEELKAMMYEVSVVVALLLEMWTIIPAPASKPCALGYYTHCTWTPWSILICLAIAGALYWIGLIRRIGE